MSVRQVPTMTFYFTHRLVVLPFHPQNVTRDPDAPRDKKLTKMSYLRLEVPTVPANVVSHFSSSLRFSPGLFSGCIRFAEVYRRHDAPCI